MHLISSRIIPFIDVESLSISRAREALLHDNRKGFILYLSSGELLSTTEERVLFLEAREALLWLNDPWKLKGRSGCEANQSPPSSRTFHLVKRCRGCVRLISDPVMFDVYVSDKRDLFVVRKGFPIPLLGTSGRWRKSNKRVFKLSDEIKSTVQRQGYYLRKLNDMRTH